MNVVIITTKGPAYHRHFCAELVRRHNVVGVLHPRRREPSRAERRALRRRSIERHGLLQHVLQRLSDRRLSRHGWNAQADLEDAQRRFFANAASDYDRLVAPLAREVDDINGAEGLALLESLAPDVVVCSGGPIYREPLIRRAGIMLNFHTGISPIYNGSLTIYWTYANRQPWLTGGTLMRMSPVVDGGDVLAHYLPPIEAGDTPATQFMRCIAGGIELYDRFLTDLSQGKPFVAVPQGPPFLLYYTHDWTIQQNLSIGRSLASGLCRKFVRSEVVHEYWNLGDGDTARAAMQRTLLGLVYRG